MLNFHSWLSVENHQNSMINTKKSSKSWPGTHIVGLFIVNRLFTSVRCVCCHGRRTSHSNFVQINKNYWRDYRKITKRKCAQILVNASLFYRRSLKRMKWFMVAIHTGLTVKSLKFYIQMTRKRWCRFCSWLNDGWGNIYYFRASSSASHLV